MDLHTPADYLSSLCFTDNIPGPDFRLNREVKV